MLIELIGSVLAILYIILAGQERTSCWIVSFVSGCAFIVVFCEAGLYGQVALHTLYCILSVVGFVYWKRGKHSSKEPVLISKMTQFEHGIYWIIGLAGVATYLNSSYLPVAPTQILDLTLTVVSVFGTILFTRKRLECWLYWMAIDVVSATLFFSQELYFSAFAFAVYPAFAWYGYQQWKIAYK